MIQEITVIAKFIKGKRKPALIIHHDLSVPKEILNTLQHISFIKFVFHPKEKGLTWIAARFLPISDLDMEICWVRDLEEILNAHDFKIFQSWILNNQNKKNEKEKKNILSDQSKYEKNAVNISQFTLIYNIWRMEKKRSIQRIWNG